jgi:MerR family redox-sensitive transcriptional activator SoxR
LTLDDIRNALGTLPDGRTPTAADWARLSRAWKAQLDERIQLLEHVRDDLSSCIGCGCLSLHVPDLATREVAKRATRATRRPR